MRIFWMSFFVGAVLALGLEAGADQSTELNGIFASDESLPAPNRMPLSSPNATGAGSQNRVRKSDIIHASRVERAKQVAQNRLEIEMMSRWSGINTARPMVSAGFIYQAPPRVGYLWVGPYATPYGIPFVQ